MAKLFSTSRVVQSYLASIPASTELVSFAPNEEKRGLRFSKPEVVVLGKVGKKKDELLRDPGRLISDFANTRDDPEGVLRFTRRYGVLQRGDRQYFVDVEEVADEFQVLCSRWLHGQKEFQDQWTRKAKAEGETATEFEKHINPSSRTRPAVKTYAVPDKGGGFQLELRPDDLLGALWLALLGFSGRTRKCENPTCSSPYFIASRKDQKYCNEACSRLVANRKWWAEKGAQWRQNKLKHERRNVE